MEFDLREHTVLLTAVGSRAYGINTPMSDLDVKGVCIPPKEYYLGVSKRFEQADSKEHIQGLIESMPPDFAAIARTHGCEGSVYEWRKFLSLAADANPNILDVLFGRDEDILLLTKAGQALRETRDLFLSAKCRWTFSGYSVAQMKRIRLHRRYLLNPPKHKPTRAEYGLPEHTLIPADQLAAVKAAVQKQIDRWEMDFGDTPEDTKLSVQAQVTSVIADMQVALSLTSLEEAKFLAAARTVGCDDNLIYVMQKEREYESASREWKQYQEWQKNRNPERAALEEKFGFDLKHGAHLYRLMLMCQEILLTGQVHVWRGPSNKPGAPCDAEQILFVRNGGWTFDRLDEWFTTTDRECDAIYREKRYVIPHQPDRKAIDTLCIEVLGETLFPEKTPVEMAERRK